MPHLTIKAESVAAEMLHAKKRTAATRTKEKHFYSLLLFPLPLFFFFLLEVLLLPEAAASEFPLPLLLPLLEPWKNDFTYEGDQQKQREQQSQHAATNEACAYHIALEQENRD